MKLHDSKIIFYQLKKKYNFLIKLGLLYSFSKKNNYNLFIKSDIKLSKMITNINDYITEIDIDISNKIIDTYNYDKKIFYQFLNNLKFNKDINNLINSLNVKDCIGLYTENIPIENITNKINYYLHQNIEQKFFICTNNIEKLINIYGDDKFIFLQKSDNKLYNDLASTIILLKCKKHYGFFTYSGCKQNSLTKTDFLYNQEIIDSL